MNPGGGVKLTEEKKQRMTEVFRDWEKRYQNFMPLFERNRELYELTIIDFAGRLSYEKLKNNFEEEVKKRLRSELKEINRLRIIDFLERPVTDAGNSERSGLINQIIKSNS